MLSNIHCGINKLVLPTVGLDTLSSVLGPLSTCSEPRLLISKMGVTPQPSRGLLRGLRENLRYLRRGAVAISDDLSFQMN